MGEKNCRVYQSIRVVSNILKLHKAQIYRNPEVMIQSLMTRKMTIAQLEEFLYSYSVQAIQRLLGVYIEKHKELKTEDLLIIITNREYGYGNNELPVIDSIAESIYKVLNIKLDAKEYVDKEGE